MCLSNNSVSKEGYIQKEVKKILDKAEEKPDATIFIIPLRLDDCEIPNRFRKWQYENYFPREEAIDSYKKIRESLKMRAKSIDIYAPMTLEDENALLWQDAIFIAKTNEKVTVSLLQRRLRIGYTKSVRLIEKMEETGLIEKSNENSFTWNLVVK